MKQRHEHSPMFRGRGTERDRGWKSGHSHNQMLPPHGPCLPTCVGPETLDRRLHMGHARSTGQLIECTYYPGASTTACNELCLQSKESKGYFYRLLYRWITAAQAWTHNKGRRLDKAEKQTAWCFNWVIMLISGCLSFVSPGSPVDRGLTMFRPKAGALRKVANPWAAAEKIPCLETE